MKRRSSSSNRTYEFCAIIYSEIRYAFVVGAGLIIPARRLSEEFPGNLEGKYREFDQSYRFSEWVRLRRCVLLRKIQD